MIKTGDLVKLTSKKNWSGGRGPRFSWNKKQVSNFGIGLVLATNNCGYLKIYWPNYNSLGLKKTLCQVWNWGEDALEVISQ